MLFCFQFYVLLGTSPISASLWDWFDFDEPSNHEQSGTNNKKYNNEEMKTKLYNNFDFCISILVIINYYRIHYYIIGFIIIGLYGLEP